MQSQQYCQGKQKQKKADRDYSTETSGRAKQLMLKVNMYSIAQTTFICVKLKTHSVQVYFMNAKSLCQEYPEANHRRRKIEGTC